MRTVKRAILFIGIIGTTVLCQDPIQGYFEWGEYDSLLIAVPAYCSQPPNRIDSTLLGRYYAYLGVAFFAKGNIADARKSFREALIRRPLMVLDSQYVTPEMMNLFADTRREIGQERERRSREDSLQAARAIASKALEERQDRAAGLWSAFRNNIAVAATFTALCAAGGGAAGYEYHTGKKLEAQFKSAAEVGDEREYDRYRTSLIKQNLNILGFSAASVVSGCLGVFFCSRSVRLYRMRAAITLSSGAYGFGLATDL